MWADASPRYPPVDETARPRGPVPPGVARPRAADAVATGKEIAHAAFRDTRPGGAPASINASLFTQWAALRGVDLFAV